jgi:hypothetical protein
MIQLEGMSKSFPLRRKYLEVVQKDAFHLSRRAPAQGTTVSFYFHITAFFHALTLLAQFLSSPSASTSSSSLAPHALQSTFGPIISQLVYTYNTSPPTDDISRAQSELAQVKDIMVQNVEQILSRGERIELLVDKTDTMASQATAFRRGARTVRRQMWWKNKRVLGLGVLVALVRTPCFSPLRA